MYLALLIHICVLLLKHIVVINHFNNHKMLNFIMNLSAPVMIFLWVCYFAIVLIAIFTAIKNSNSLISKIILIAVFVFIPFSAVIYLIWNRFNKPDHAQGIIE